MTPRLEKSLASTLALRAACAPIFLPLFDHCVSLARDSAEHGHSQRAGRELAEARKVAAYTVCHCGQPSINGGDGSCFAHWGKPFAVRYVHKVAPRCTDTGPEVCIPANAFSNARTLAAALRSRGVLADNARIREWRVEGDKVVVFPTLPGLTTYWHAVVLQDAS